MKTTMVGLNPIAEEFKKRGWKYKESGVKGKRIEQYLKWGWKRWALLNGELVEDEEGIWAKNPEDEPESIKNSIDINTPGVMKHCRGGGFVCELDGKFYNGKGEHLPNFKMDW